MKKFAFCFALMIMTLLSLAGCGSSSDEPAEAAESTSEETVETTESTEEASDPVDDPSLVWKYDGIENTVNPSSVSISIGRKLGNTNFQELWVLSNEFENAGVFIYADGEQVGYKEESDLKLDTESPISGSHIEEGLHSVELVQYADNDDLNGEIIFYVRTTYEIK